MSDSFFSFFFCSIYFALMAIAVLELVSGGAKHSKRAFVYALTMVLWVIVVNNYSPPGEIMTIVIGFTGAIVVIWAVANLINIIDFDRIFEGGLGE